MELATLKDVYLESELSLALGISRRASHKIATLLGRPVGNKRLVLRADLLEWLSKQPKASERPRRAEKAATIEQAHEFQISPR